MWKSGDSEGCVDLAWIGQALFSCGLFPKLENGFRSCIESAPAALLPSVVKREHLQNFRGDLDCLLLCPQPVGKGAFAVIGADDFRDTIDLS